MTIDSYVVFVPYKANPLLSESYSEGIVDPFIDKLNPLALFPIDDWSMDVEQTLNIGSQSTGAGAGKITFNPFSITRKVDKISPKLFLNSCSGTPFEFVDLIQHESRPESPGDTFLAWRFQLVAVKTVSWSHDEERPKETVTFEYGGLTIDYYPRTNEGTLGKLYHAGWDRVKNRAIG